MTYRTCQRGGTCHQANVEYDGTSATRVLGDTPEERAKVPEELSDAILEAVEEAVRNPPPEQTKLVTDGGREQDADITVHARATCPDCGMLNVTIRDSPIRPTQMYCTNCEWNSLEGSR